jgi:hypothetical protein
MKHVSIIIYYDFSIKYASIYIIILSKNYIEFNRIKCYILLEWKKLSYRIQIMFQLKLLCVLFHSF